MALIEKVSALSEKFYAIDQEHHLFEHILKDYLLKDNISELHYIKYNLVQKYF